MPYTYPPPGFETTSSPSSTYVGMEEFAQFLNGTHASQTNAVPWACIDCYDGTTREQPTDGSFDNLSGGNLWRNDTGTPGQNAWAVFQAPSGGDVAARYQVYIEMTTFTSAFIGVFMLNDWSVGAGTDSNPDIPTVSLGVPPFAGGMDGTIANHTNYKWKAWVDEGGFMLDVFPTVSGAREWLYVGDLDTDNPAADDPRPFIISRNPDGTSWGAVYHHIAESDDSTVIDTLDEVEQQAGMTDSSDQDAGLLRQLSSVAVYGSDAGDRYRKGKFRNCAAISRHTRTTDQTIRITAGDGPSAFEYEVWGNGITFAQIVTLHPAGTSLPGGHIEISPDSVPTTLVP